MIIKTEIKITKSRVPMIPIIQPAVTVAEFVHTTLGSALISLRANDPMIQAIMHNGQKKKSPMRPSTRTAVPLAWLRVLDGGAPRYPGWGMPG